MSRFTAFVASLSLLCIAAPAQWVTHKVEEVGIRIQAPKELNPVPLKLGNQGMTNYMRAQFLPVTARKYIIKEHTRFRWGMQVLEFGADKTAPITGPEKGDGDGKDDKETEAKKRLAAMLASRMEEYKSKNFHEYVTEKDPAKRDRTFVVEGKVVKKRGKRPAYKYYEFYDEGQMNTVRGTRDTFYRYKMVACYELEGREVVLYFHWPVFKKPKPAGKYKKIANRMIESLTPLSEKLRGRAVVASSSKKDKYANTPARTKALTKALENIKSLKGWDYFTTPNYIVFFSWDANKPDKKTKSLAFARMTGKQMEQVRTLYTEHYPPHEDLATYYPVLRICHTKDLFDVYGGTSGGTVGWFNPGSKELVIFNDHDAAFGGKKTVKTVAFHEGWHQYADSYFGGATLHRWFGEGQGDWFGAWTKTGSKWSFAPARRRIIGPTGILLQVRRKKHVPFRTIVSWNMDKFYGPKKLYYYAQGYAMVDFLRRGKKLLRGKWNQSWDRILDDYRKTLLETKDQKKALEVAYGNVDMTALDLAFQEFVKKCISKK